MPKTLLGKWALGLIVAMPVFLFAGVWFTELLNTLVPTGDAVLEDVAGRSALSLTMLIAGIVSGISAFITGLIAIRRQKERAPSVYAATVIGALFMLLLIAEILFLE
jgi:hypothetical protein